MWRGLQVFLLVAAVGGLAFAPALAQTTDQADFKQVKLTNKMVENFIEAQKAMTDYAEKNKNAASDELDEKAQKELDNLAKKHGFDDFASFDDVAFNISMIMGGLDPQTGKFTDPVASIKQEIADITADKTIPEKDKKQILDELNEALKSTAPLQYPENVEVVKQYREKIDQVLQ